MRCLVLLFVFLALTAVSDARTWKSVGGHFSIQGKFVSLTSGTDGSGESIEIVTIETDDGDVATVPMKKLSADDRSFVRTQVNNKRKEAKANENEDGEGKKASPKDKAGKETLKPDPKKKNDHTFTGIQEQLEAKLDEIDKKKTDVAKKTQESDKAKLMACDKVLKSFKDSAARLWAYETIGDVLIAQLNSGMQVQPILQDLAKDIMGDRYLSDEDKTALKERAETIRNNMDKKSGGAMPVVFEEKQDSHPATSKKPGGAMPVVFEEKQDPHPETSNWWQKVWTSPARPQAPAPNDDPPTAEEKKHESKGESKIKNNLQNKIGKKPADGGEN